MTRSHAPRQPAWLHCAECINPGPTMKKQGSIRMSGYTPGASSLPWWKEPTKDQWYAYLAAWMGWTLDAFDFTVFLVLVVSIAKEFDASLTLVSTVVSLTLFMRLFGAVASGWMA